MLELFLLVPEENIKIAEEIVYNKKKLKDFKEHPGDTLTGQEQKGQYYYFKKLHLQVYLE
jgi:hypothetical protein